MKTILCQWCGAVATGTVTGKGVKPWVTIPHCDRCYDRTYQEVRSYPERTWKMLVQAPSLFDFLPKEEESS